MRTRIRSTQRTIENYSKIPKSSKTRLKVTNVSKLSSLLNGLMKVIGKFKDYVLRMSFKKIITLSLDVIVYILCPLTCLLTIGCTMARFPFRSMMEAKALILCATLLLIVICYCLLLTVILTLEIRRSTSSNISKV